MLSIGSTSQGTLGPYFFHAFVEFVLSLYGIVGSRALTELTPATPVTNPINGTAQIDISGAVLTLSTT